jgi:hypothetical protein
MNFGKELSMNKKAAWAERHDPWPHISWAHYGPQPMTTGEKIGWTIWTVAVITAVVMIGAM